MSLKTYNSSQIAYAVSDQGRVVAAGILDAVAPIQERGEAEAIVTEQSLLDLSNSQLIEIYNANSPKAVNKFSSKAKGAERTWNLLEHHRLLGSFDDREVTVETEPETKPKPKKTGGKKTGTFTEPKTAAEVKPAREGTKQAKLIDALNRPEGATMNELTVEMAEGGKPWQEQTIRAGFYYDVKSIKGYGVRTEFWDAAQLEAAGHNADADEAARTGEKIAVYFLVLPEGLDAPLPHIKRKTPKKNEG